MPSVDSITTYSVTSKLLRPLFWLALAVVLVLSYSWMSPSITAPNERTRLYLTLSLLEDGDVAVGDEVKRYGVPNDISKRDGKYYTDKAPGSSVVAMPFVAVYQSWVGWGEESPDGRPSNDQRSDSIEKLTNFARTFVMIPFALLSFLLVRAVAVGVGVSEPIANRAAVAFGVGTSFLHYGAAMYGHALATCAALLAAYAVLRSLRTENTRRRDAWRFLAGFAGACTFAMEYQAAVLCIALALGYLSTREHWSVRAVAAPLLGALIPIGLTLFYNHLAFGGPLETGYAHLPSTYFQAKHDEGLYGVSTPTLEALYGLLLSPSRGLLTCAPIVMLGLFSLGKLWKKCRWLAIYAGAGIGAYVFLMAGAEIWYAGWSFGPRLLVPIFGLAAVAGACTLEAAEKSRSGLYGGLLAFLSAGMLYNVAVTTAFPELPHHIEAPLSSIALPIFDAGHPSPNLGMSVFGLEGTMSLLPLVIVLAALLGYMMWPLIQDGRLRVKGVVAFVVTMFMFGLFVHEYPEENDKRAAKFAKFATKRRVAPK
jgi:hypothetical protein